jgi:O-methyltransferase/methyltransferase family protein
MKHDAMTPDLILRLGQAYRESKVLLSAVELGLFTVLAERPLDLEALSERLGINARGARDFLDSLVALGMLVRHDDGHYANSLDAELFLDRNKPAYVGDLLDSASTRHYGVWSSLTAALRTGTPQSDKSMVSKFSGLYADDSAREQFASSMTIRTRPVAKALTERFPWADYRTLIDIGGCEGCLPVEIAQVHLHLTGGAFDLPALHPLFNRYVQKHALSDRLRFYPGDFFNDPLPTADVLVLGRVLHNWDLETKRMLLKKALDALPPGGALIVYEHLIDDARRVHSAGLLASLHMLLMSDGGFNFTGADCISWMRETDFGNIRIEPLTVDQTMVVGFRKQL